MAALTIVCWHAPYFLSERWMPKSGYLAVDLFFLLSGIVIAHSYDGRLGAGLLDWRGFMRIRVVRFYPFYLLGIVMAVATAWAAAHTGHATSVHGFDLVWSAALTALFVPQVIDSSRHIFPLNIPYWSLLAELVANVVFAILWRRLSRVVLLSIAAVSAIGLVAVSVSLGALGGGSNWPTFHVGLLRVTFAFFTGVLIVRNVKRRSIRSDATLVALSVAIVAIMWADPGKYRAAYDALCVLLVVPLFGVAALWFEAGPLTSAFARFSGDISYGLYAIHVPTQQAILGVLGLVGLRDALIQPWSILPDLAFLVVLVLILNRTFDVPLRRALTRGSWRGEPAPF